MYKPVGVSCFWPANVPIVARPVFICQSGLELRCHVCWLDLLPGALVVVVAVPSGEGVVPSTAEERRIVARRREGWPGAGLGLVLRSARRARPRGGSVNNAGVEVFSAHVSQAFGVPHDSLASHPSRPSRPPRAITR